MLFSKQNNNAPGADVFCNKFFLVDLKYWTFRYFQEAIINNQMYTIVFEGVSQCIPKQGKLMNELKTFDLIKLNL